MAKVEVVSSCLVGTTRGVTATASISRLELITWDLRFLPSPCIQRGLLFHTPQSQQQTLIQHLQNSFSRALDFFPPLSGRLAAASHDGATTFFVDCNDAGAEFTHAVAATVSVSDIIAPDCIPAFVSSSFFPLNDVANFEGTSKPLMAVQVTELADGLFIGCAANHAVVDGASFWHFVSSWSEISRGFVTISKAPVFDRSFTSAAAVADELIHFPAAEKSGPTPPPLPQKVFHFSRESLARLKAKANSEAGTDKISTLQALLAHLWRSTVRCRHSGTAGDFQEARIMMVIGARGRNASLSDAYFGNAAYLATMAVSESDLVQEGLGSAALRINELVSQQSDDATRRSVEEKVEVRRFGGTGAGPTLIVGSSPRYDVYGCDFGWGKPIAVRSGKAQKFNGLVVVFPAAEPGGIDVEVCLPPEVLQSMGNDAEFTAAFTS